MCDVPRIMLMCLFFCGAFAGSSEKKKNDQPVPLPGPSPMPSLPGPSPSGPVSPAAPPPGPSTPGLIPADEEVTNKFNFWDPEFHPQPGELFRVTDEFCAGKCGGARDCRPLFLDRTIMWKMDDRTFLVPR